MADEGVPLPRRALVVDAAGAVELVVDGRSFQVSVEGEAGTLVDELAAALAQGLTLSVELTDGGTLLVNGGRVGSVAVLCDAPDSGARARRAVLDDSCLT